MCLASPCHCTTSGSSVAAGMERDGWLCSLSVSCSENAPECLSGNRGKKTFNFWPLDVGCTPVVQKRCWTLRDTFCTHPGRTLKTPGQPRGHQDPRGPQELSGLSSSWDRNVILVHCSCLSWRSWMVPSSAVGTSLANAAGLKAHRQVPAANAFSRFGCHYISRKRLARPSKLRGSVWVYWVKGITPEYKWALSPAPSDLAASLISKMKLQSAVWYNLFDNHSSSPHTLNLRKTSESFGHLAGEVTSPSVWLLSHTISKSVPVYLGISAGGFPRVWDPGGFQFHPTQIIFQTVSYSI